jgi:hypothetical protein
LVIRDWQSNRSDITKAANSPDRPIATRLGRWPELGTTDFQDVAACLEPILVFDFCERGTSEREIESKIQAPFKREGEASSSLKWNKWGQPVGGNVYAGFELELAGVERP